MFLSMIGGITRNRVFELRWENEFTMEKHQIKLKDGVKLKKFDYKKYLKADFIGSAIMECLLNNDPDGIVELLSFRHKNPTIKTLAKIVSTVAH